MNSFEKYFWDVIKNHYTDFKGVATRKQYWMFVLYSWVFIIIPIILILVLFINTEAISLIITLSVILLIFFIATFLPSLAISVRRLHDIGLSGWFYFLSLIPYLGSLIMFVFYLLPSKIEDNKYYNKKHNKVSINDIDLLEKLHSLKEKGVITEEEFNTKKSELLK